MNLIETAHLKALCAKLGIDYVTLRGDELMMRFSMAADIDLMGVLAAVKAFPQVFRVKPVNPPELYFYERGKDTETLLRDCVKVMEQVVARFEAQEERKDEDQQ